MSNALYLRRRLRNMLAIGLATAATVLGLFFLGWILLTTLGRGMAALDLALFTEMTPPPGAEGGMANALFGSVVMSLLAIAIGAPVGIAAGTFLAEYARGRWFGELVRFVNDILLSAPSIVIGLFVYALLVQHTRFSAIAGALALAFIVIPVVVRTTDEMLRLVPVQMREAALSLGIPQWKLTVQVLYRAALPGILTGVLLALARISGETAPLLFTAFSNQFWSADLTAAMANVPVVVFQYAMSPFPAWQALAWSGALVITLFVLVLSLTARAFLLRKTIRND
jgi:phosphate transport system permease protein